MKLVICLRIYILYIFSNVEIYVFFNLGSYHFHGIWWMSWNQTKWYGEWQQRWLNLSRWVLVTALIKLWQALAIDFPLECRASLKLDAQSTVGKQSSSKVFPSFTFWGWQITHLFLLPINMTQTSSLPRRNIFTLQRWLEWTPVFLRSTRADCENVNQSCWIARGLFSGKSHQRVDAA